MSSLERLRKLRALPLFPLVLVVALGLALRFLWLDRVPSAISGDELDYVLDAKAIFLSGKDLTGAWSPFSLVPAPHRIPKAELPSLVVSPLIGLMELSLFSARLPYVVYGVVFLIAIFLVTKRLFGDEAALIVAAVAAINPWSFYFSRTAFDIPLAGAFYFIAFWILISLKGWKLLFAFPFLFLAFFSYIGTKLIFIPFVLITSFYSWFVLNKRKFTRQYLLLILFCLFIFGWFLLSFKHQSARVRADEVLTPFHSMVAQRVNDERRLSTGHPLMFFFSNKAVVFSKLFLEKYLKIFSVDFLFLYGEARATYSVWTHGPFYYLDLIFMLLGFYFLLRRNRNLWLFLTALILLAPLPAAISTVGEEYALRGVLLYPILILLTGLGIWGVVFLPKRGGYRLGIVGFLVLVYGVQLANFLNIYFFRNPIYNSEGFGFSNRIWVNYVNLAKPKVEKVWVVTRDELGFLKQYLFYSGVFDQEVLTLVRRMITDGEYRWENVYFVHESRGEVELGENEVVISPPDFDLVEKEKYPYWLTIPQLSDGGEVYKIINDSVCFQYGLGRYPAGIKFGDFKVEELSEARFCQKFITDLTGYVNFKRKKPV